MKLTEVLLFEAAAPGVGRKYQHIEDLVITNGSSGGLHAAERMKHMVDNYDSIELKWDGMPVVYWGRDEKGVFRMIPKNAWAYLSRGSMQTKAGVPTLPNNPQDIMKFILGTGGGADESRTQFAKQVADLWPLFEQISPDSGYLEGGLLFYPGVKPDGATAMPIYNKNTKTFDFKPNITGFHIPVNSKLGKQIGSPNQLNAKLMVAATGWFPTLGSTEEGRFPNAESLSQPDIIVQGTTYVEEMPGVDTSYIDKVSSFISSNANVIDNYLAPKKGLSKPGGILYTYLNTHLRTQGLVKDFPAWAQANLSEGQAQGMLADQKGYEAVLGAVEGLTNAKMQLIKSLSLGLHGGIMQTNPEGYVQAHPEISFDNPLPGQFLKLIDQQNWAPKKISEATAQPVQPAQPQIDAVVGWGRGMGHKGHMLLARAVIIQAQQLKAAPLFFVSETMGKDDPLTPEEKIYIYKKVFPQEAGIFHTGPSLNSIFTNISSQYKNIVLVLGEDQVQEFQWLMKPNKQGELNYKSYGLDSLQIIARQQVSDPAQSEAGPRATPMREILKNPNATEEEQFAYWREAMPDALSDAEVLEFMNRAKSRLNVPKKVKEPAQKAAKQIKDKALKESVVDIVRKAKPLLKEASLEKKLQFVKLMKVALKEGFDERMALIRKLVSTGKYDASDLELASDEELQQLLADENQQGVAEGLGLYGPFTVTINTGERPQSRTKTKKFRREDDAILWAQDWLEDAPQYVFATAEVTDLDGNVVWTTDEQGVAEGSDAEAYKQKLLSSLPQMMRFYEKNVQGWKPSEEQMLAAVETGYTVMKHTGDVKQAGKAVMDELNTLHRMSQGQEGVAEGEVNEVTKQSAIKQYQDIQNYKVKPSPKQDEKEFIKININRPKKAGVNESTDYVDEK